jgi:DNA-binding protein YbaB
MANVFEQVKQAMQMRKETKRIQNEIEKITFEYANGGITCVARGDFSIVSIKIAPEALKEVIAGKPERFDIMLLNVVNGALKGVRKQTQEAMAKLMQGSNLGDMLGGGMG